MIRSSIAGSHRKDLWYSEFNWQPDAEVVKSGKPPYKGIDLNLLADSHERQSWPTISLVWALPRRYLAIFIWPRASGVGTRSNEPPQTQGGVDVELAWDRDCKLRPANPVLLAGSDSFSSLSTWTRLSCGDLSDQ